MDLRQKLLDEIDSQLKNLDKLEIGSQDYVRATISIAKLVEKVNTIDQIEYENSNEEEQLKNEKRDSIIKHCLTGLSILGGFALTVWGAVNAWDFEQTGTVTTIPGREFVRRIFKS